MSDTTSFIGKSVTMTPTQGCYQKSIPGRVVAETATQFTVDALGFTGKKYRKADGMPVAKYDRQFPCYKAVINETPEGQTK